MKFKLLLIFGLVLCLKAKSQKTAKEKFYLYDANFKSVVSQDSARYFMRVHKLGDTLWQWDTYNKFGPMVSSEQFKDHDGQYPNGDFIFYHPTGYMDSTGRMVNGLPEGDWNFCNDTGKIILQKKYLSGKLLLVRDLLLEEKMEKEKGDSLSGEIKKDERESSFPGGLVKWQRYLMKNIKYPDRAYNSKIDGTIVVQFIVNTKGKTEFISLYKSVEYSLDQEAMRILRDSPDWTPAHQDGRLVKSFKRQPIVFRFQ